MRKFAIFAKENQYFMDENKIILIPSTQSGIHVGSVFNNIFIISNTTEESSSDSVMWDFSNVFSIHPFMVFALSLFKSVSEKRIELINAHSNITEYLRLLHFDTFYEARQSCCSELYEYSKRNFIPVCRFAATDDEIQHNLQCLIQSQYDISALSTPLAYIFGELICNVAQHSEHNDVYLFSQYAENGEELYVCIADKGIGIYSSYVRADKYLSQIGDNDAVALRLANEGYSAKNLPGAENRGFGISTSKKMLVNGLCGSFYVMSGNALQISSADEDDKYLELPQNIEWQGTMIFLRIPCKVPDGFNYIDYLE